MTDFFIPAIFGLIGGIIRGMVGVIKYYKLKNKKKLKISYFIITIIIASLIGAATSIAVSSNYLLNLIAGYAGIDFLESIMKIIRKKSKD